MLISKKAIYKWYIENNTPIVEITQKSSNITFRLKAKDFLTLLNTGVSERVQLIEGTLIEINFNLKSKHLYMNGSDINTSLTDPLFLDALKRELANLINSTYEEEGAPW